MYIDNLIILDTIILTSVIKTVKKKNQKTIKYFFIFLQTINYIFDLLIYIV